MSETEDLRATGDRIEELLDQLATVPDRRAGQWGEELVRLVTDLYGAALERVIAAAAQSDAPRGRVLLEHLAEDDLIASLMLVHDLHPYSLRQRLEAALEDLRTSMPAADVRLVHLDPESASVRLRLAVSGSQPGTAGALERRLREVIENAAPELETIDIDRLLPPTPVHFGRKPAPHAEPGTDSVLDTSSGVEPAGSGADGVTDLRSEVAEAH